MMGPACLECTLRLILTEVRPEDPLGAAHESCADAQVFAESGGWLWLGASR